MSFDMLCIDCNYSLKDDLNDSRFYGIKKAHIEQEKKISTFQGKIFLPHRGITHFFWQPN
jgi:hypothetical protein